MIATRKMEPKKRNKDRQWRNRPKVSSNLSKDFPWEVVLRFVKGHARSIILLQMVDKNLKNLIQTDHKFWLETYRKEISSHAFAVRSVKDPIYPNLRLWKPHLTGLPVYAGGLKGDPDDHKLIPGFEAMFSSYVRRVYALKYGTRCGMCGCRYRHEPYWSLRMRVCRLCMENNTISGELLCRKYGVDFSDIIASHHGKFFFYSCSVTFAEDRVSMHGMAECDVTRKGSTYLFWLPHLRQFLDFPALYQKQQEKKRAAEALGSIVKRRFIQEKQHLYFTRKSHYSIDCLMVVLYRNDKKRITHPYGSGTFGGGPAWLFPEHPRGSSSKVLLRNKINISLYYRLAAEFEDCVV